jgi:hypothetical protein
MIREILFSRLSGGIILVVMFAIMQSKTKPGEEMRCYCGRYATLMKWLFFIFGCGAIAVEAFKNPL